jgi:hypothetical protein
VTKDPWTDPDPQPGDFDAYLQTVDPRAIEFHEGNPDAKVRLLISLNGEDAARLAELAQERGQAIGEVVAELVRNA